MHIFEPEHLLTRREIADRMRCSERHIQNLNASGRMPKPVKLGRCTRWIASEIDLWISIGAPNRDKFETAKAAREKA